MATDRNEQVIDNLVTELPIEDESGEKTVSFFEFWPTWLIYLPVAFQWILLAGRYRSLTLPLIANPELTVSGMVGVPKSELMAQASEECAKSILDWKIHTVTDQSISMQTAQWLVSLKAMNIDFPFVCKPDIGCRGSGVKLIADQSQLEAVMTVYPIGATLMAQKLASWEPEVGIFFVKYPDESKGKIMSMTLKYTPYVRGDGKSTLGQLVEQDLRASQLLSIYKERHLDNWQDIIADGVSYRLVFSASHCRGAIFRDACEHITSALTTKINSIMSGLPEFYYGRLDVKFSNLDDLKQGKNLQIIEINGASAESIQIWDKDATLRCAIKTLLWQYRTLFTIGSINRTRGYNPPTVSKILGLWKKEKDLVKHYPLTD